MRFNFFSFILFLIALTLLSLSILDISGYIQFFPNKGILGVMNLPSFGVIIGGILMSATLSYPIIEIKNAIQFTINLFFYPSYGNEIESKDLRDILEWQKKLKENSTNTRKELSKSLHNSFEGYLFLLMGTNYSAEKIEELGYIKAKERYTQNNNLVSIFEYLADTSPAYGMLGTLTGLIFMLQSFENVKELGEGLAFALMTTLYGLLLAYAVFSPLAKKAELRAKKILKRDLFILNGLVMIVKGEEPLVVFDHLCAEREGFRFDQEFDQINTI